jgi:hypothetical protein
MENAKESGKVTLSAETQPGMRTEIDQKIGHAITNPLLFMFSSPVRSFRKLYLMSIKEKYCKKLIIKQMK